jgi:integrase
MKGHVRERGKGNWYAVLSVNDPVSGKRKVKWRSLTGCKGKREAQDECAKLVTQLNSGAFVHSSKVTLAEFLDRWLGHVKTNISPRTFERYEEIAHKNIAPLLGAVVLSKLKAIQISEAYAKAVTSGRRDGKGGLSARTVHHMHRILSQALKQAVRWDLIVRSPCDQLEKKDRPKVEKRAVATIDALQTIDAIEAARDRRLFIPILLGSMGGMRRGEIVALRRKSVDLERGQIAIISAIEQTKNACREKEVKGSRCRTIAMPAMLVDEMRRHFITQAEEMLRLGIRPDGDTLVVMSADGKPIQPRSLTKTVSDFMKGLGSKVRLHGLRHSHASHLLAENVHPKVVQERLGHSSIAITMDIYSHVMPNMQSEAAAKVDAVLKAAQKNRT